MKSVKKTIPAALSALLGAVTVGLILGRQWPPIDHLQWPMLPPSPREAFVAGVVAGVILSATFTTLFDRRHGIAVFNLIALSGFTMSAVFEPTFTLVTVRQVLMGVGVEGLITVIPGYVGEISHPSARGKLGVFFQFFLITGILWSYSVDWIPDAFDVMSYDVVCCVFVTVNVITSFLVPVVPYHYSGSFREDDNDVDYDNECVVCIQSEDHCDVHVVEEFKKLLNVKWRKEVASGLKLCTSDLFTGRVNRKSLLIGIGCMVFHQLCGTYFIVSYLNHLLHTMKFYLGPNELFVIVGFVEMIMIICTMVLIDVIGRVKLLIFSTVLMGISSMGLCCCIFVTKFISSTAANNISITFIVIYILAYSFGIGPVPWVIIGEIFSLQAKSWGMCFATAINCFMFFIVPCLYHYVVQILGFDGGFLVYFVVCIIALLFFWHILPETNNLNLSEIQWKMSVSCNSETYVQFS